MRGTQDPVSQEYESSNLSPCTKTEPMRGSISKSLKPYSFQILNKLSYFLLTSPQPRLSSLLLKHILAGSPFENRTQPQHCEKRRTPFSPRISRQSFVASSVGIVSSEPIFVTSTPNHSCKNSQSRRRPLQRQTDFEL